MVLLFCCFVVSSHSKTIMPSYYWGLLNQLKRWELPHKFDEVGLFYVEMGIEIGDG